MLFTEARNELPIPSFVNPGLGYCYKRHDEVPSYNIEPTGVIDS